jgi:predicted ArsR family transcriptional regulator
MASNAGTSSGVALVPRAVHLLHQERMMPGYIPDEVRDFIFASIDSIAQLEALLLLRDNAQHKWTCKTIAERIYIHESQAAALLAKLVARGFIVAEGTGPTDFYYQPKSEDIARSIDRLAEVYSKYLVPVTNLVHQKSRRDIVELADAFKLKKDE